MYYLGEIADEGDNLALFLGGNVNLVSGARNNELYRLRGSYVAVRISEHRYLNRIESGEFIVAHVHGIGGFVIYRKVLERKHLALISFVTGYIGADIAVKKNGGCSVSRRSDNVTFGKRISYLFIRTVYVVICGRGPRSIIVRGYVLDAVHRVVAGVAHGEAHTVLAGYAELICRKHDGYNIIIAGILERIFLHGGGKSLRPVGAVDERQRSVGKHEVVQRRTGGIGHIVVQPHAEHGRIEEISAFYENLECEFGAVVLEIIPEIVVLRLGRRLSGAGARRIVNIYTVRGVSRGSGGLPFAVREVGFASRLIDGYRRIEQAHVLVYLVGNRDEILEIAVGTYLGNRYLERERGGVGSELTASDRGGICYLRRFVLYAGGVVLCYDRRNSVGLVNVVETGIYRRILAVFYPEAKVGAGAVAAVDRRAVHDCVDINVRGIGIYPVLIGQGIPLRRFVLPYAVIRRYHRPIALSRRCRRECEYHGCERKDHGKAQNQRHAFSENAFHSDILSDSILRKRMRLLPL